jgi:hypothetical protein
VFSFSWEQKRADFWAVYEPWLNKTGTYENPMRQRVIEEWHKFVLYNMGKARKDLAAHTMHPREKYEALYAEGWSVPQAYKIIGGTR